MKRILIIAVLLTGVFVLQAQVADSILISTSYAFGYDRCNNDDGKIRLPDDTTLTYSDSTRCFAAHVSATSKAGICWVIETDLTYMNVYKGFVKAEKYPRKFLGMNLAPNKCRYRKFGTWKKYTNDVLVEEVNYQGDGPIVLDNLGIHYADLHTYYVDPRIQYIGN